MNSLQQLSFFYFVQTIFCLETTLWSGQQFDDVKGGWSVQIVEIGVQPSDFMLPSSHGAVCPT